ncbi:phosphate/phosphite/phosphonate ABC transporter substrate-binding protein [Sandaracinus amylolyticus]|uniref:phosphate/phosphite/phosphonate ABC transporter substrate-binding protein n=1 Tax=Sandaracinus amylolyticus TaxID=927083 RepID=UPI001F3E4A73|nr:PhnD/SsuA/transferrin family substrate-binding protein [Sandaracinus amylolyticus]UJR84066.1 Hypothetical protein I5071_61370 [Sandaracinus amylolyticus]
MDFAARIRKDHGVLIRFFVAKAMGAATALARSELARSDLERRLGATVRFELAESYADLEAAVVGKQAHLVWAPPLVCARIQPHAWATFKLARRGRSTYRTAILALRGKVDLERARGLRAAWVDRSSLGGYLLAREHIRKTRASYDAVVREEVFLGSQPEAIAAVLDGKADITAVAVSDDSISALHAGISTYVSESRVPMLESIAVTGEVPTDALVVTHALERESADDIVERLFGATAGRGPSALRLAMEAEGFERASPSEYAEVLRLVHEA